ELDAARRQLFIRLLDVVRLERDRGERADAVFVSGRCAEDDARFGFADLHFDPAHAGTELLVRQIAEAELVAITRQALLLIADGNRGELDLLDHARNVGTPGAFVEDGNTSYSCNHYSDGKDKARPLHRGDAAARSRRPRSFAVRLSRLSVSLQPDAWRENEERARVASGDCRRYRSLQERGAGRSSSSEPEAIRPQRARVADRDAGALRPTAVGSLRRRARPLRSSDRSRSSAPAAHSSGSRRDP